jgi:hypothetical protein
MICDLGNGSEILRLQYLEIHILGHSRETVTTVQRSRIAFIKFIAKYGENLKVRKSNSLPKEHHSISSTQNTQRCVHLRIDVLFVFPSTPSTQQMATHQVIRDCSFRYNCKHLKHDHVVRNKYLIKTIPREKFTCP